MFVHASWPVAILSLKATALLSWLVMGGAATSSGNAPWRRPLALRWRPVAVALLALAAPWPVASWNGSAVGGFGAPRRLGGAAAAPEEERCALAALVVSGHKAVDVSFVEQSACAALAMIASARGAGAFRGDAVVMAGPLGAGSPHDPASWRRAAPGWRAEHASLVAALEARVAEPAEPAEPVAAVPSPRRPTRTQTW